MAAAQQGMDDQIARVRSDAELRVDEAVQARIQAEADADSVRRQAAADRDGVGRQAQAGAAQVLTIPIPSWEVRTAARRIESVIVALHQIDYVLEVRMAEDADGQSVNAERVGNFARTVQRQAEALPQELDDLPAGFTARSEVEAAAGYAEAAADACRAFLRRISIAVRELGHRDSSPDAEILAAVIGMLADPQVQALMTRLRGGGRVAQSSSEWQE